MAKAKQLPSGNWRIRVYVGKKPDGTPQYESITAESKKEAERQAAIFEYKENAKREKGLTIGEAISLYIEVNTNVLSPASIRKYDSMSRNNYESIKDKYVCDMKQSDYQAFVNEIALDHSPKSVASICGLLTAAIKEYDPDINITLKKPQIRKISFVIPTDEQVKQLIDGAGSPGMELAFIMGATLGMRRSEICALTWDDIDGDTIHITKAMVQDKKNKWVIKSTKTSAGTRDLEVPDFVSARLNEMKKEAKGEGSVFAFTPSAITMRFMKVCKNVGVNCRFHDLRHYNASVMLALGIPDKYAMQRMGHATPNMLKSVYQHLIDEKKTQVTSEINSYMKKAYDTKYDTDSS